MKGLGKNKQEIILYLIFGVGTTIVNIVAYAIATRVLSLGVVIATCFEWVLSVIFAYVTNRKYVFRSKSKGVKTIGLEIINFFGCRFFSGILDMFLMWMFVDVIGFADLVIKIISNFIVVVINYVASKLWIFKSRQ